MPARRRANPETALMKAMLRYCRLRGLAVERRNVAGVRPFVDPKSGKVYRVKLGTKGQADITGTLPPGCPHPGRRFELEVKVPGRRPTPEQYAFLRAAGRAGAIALWCDSVAGLARFLDLILAGYVPCIADDGGVDFDPPATPHAPAPAPEGPAR